MNPNATRVLLSIIAVLLTIGLTLAKSIDSSDPEQFQKNQLELTNDELPLDNALFKFFLAREILNRQRSYDLEDRQRKRNYWKQCAFNAVSCFGKK
ncbi:UNVERIFIED_CONTAM: hypothetical protein PYX00_010524 [Menopon gallinae]|uniref:Prohormone-1 n=1 Tax=Menopon gallinae TaxID=328185 RepID=A0AAW2HGR1_9NEOP